MDQTWQTREIHIGEISLYFNPLKGNNFNCKNKFDSKNQNFKFDDQLETESITKKDRKNKLNVFIQTLIVSHQQS